MKKVVTSVASAVLALLMFAGCQPTPEKEIVAGKNDVYEAIMDAPEQTETKLFSVPENWSEEIMQNATGNKIFMDAAILCNTVGRASVTEGAQVLDFSQEQLDEVIDYFFGDNPLYDDTYIATKGEIGYQIIEIKRLLTLPQEELDAAYNIPKERLEQMVKELEKSYAAAPEKVDREELSGELYPDDKDGAMLLEASAQTKTGFPGSIYATTYPTDSKGGSIYVQVDEQDYDAALIGDDYETAIRKFIEDFGLSDMVLTRKDEVTNNEGEDMGMRYYYSFAVDRIPVKGKCNLVQDMSLDYAPAMHSIVETVSFDVQNNKVTGISWNYGTIGKIVKENVALMPFADIQQKFKEHIFRQPIFAGGTSSDPYIITKIELCMVPIAEKDSLNTVSLVPAWNFYGFPKMSKEAYMPGEIPEDYTECVLTLSAIDGSILT